MPEPGNPQAWNRYSYVYNNPLKYTDPTGFFTEDAIKGHLHDTYGEEEGNRILAEWRGDEAWWNMLQTAEAGDELVLHFGGLTFTYTFSGQGAEVLTGISYSRGHSRISETFKSLTIPDIAREWFNPKQNGRRADRLSFEWVGFMRWENKRPAFYIREGYEMAAGEYSWEQRAAISVTIGGTVGGIARRALPASSPLLVKETTRYSAAGVGITVSWYYFELTHMQEGDVTVRISHKDRSIYDRRRASLRLRKGNQGYYLR